MAAVRPVFKLLRLSQYPILEQLRLEQALLRVDRGSWLLVNDGTPDPAIVMGVSGQAVMHLYRCSDLAVYRRACCSPASPGAGSIGQLG